MNAKTKDEIRRHVNSTLTELQNEMNTQGGKSFKFQLSDYAGGLTIKLEEVDAPSKTNSGFALGGATLGSSTLASTPSESSEDGDE